VKILGFLWFSPVYAMATGDPFLLGNGGKRQLRLNLSHKPAPAGLDAVAHNFRVACHSGEMFFTVILTPRNFVPKGTPIHSACQTLRCWLTIVENVKAFTWTEFLSSERHPAQPTP
jgi:hypothetical protein